jgi:hypothetical protein
MGRHSGTATVYVSTSGVDPSGLGRWSWYLLEGEIRSKTYHLQHMRYILENFPTTIPSRYSRRNSKLN